MSNTYFQFKQFTVYHHLCAMKVGVDGVTLGAWADVNDAKNILDIGAGSGLIALALSQRTENNVVITAIDIDKNSVTQANENIQNSKWKDRITVFHASLQDFANENFEKYDLIVCNPPFFINSLKSISGDRNKARHADTLPHFNLIENSKKLLSPDGKLCIIMPVNEGNQFIHTAQKQHLFCTKKVTVFPNIYKPAKRLLLEFSLKEKKCEESQLTIERERLTYTAEYAELVKDFYLKL